MSFKLHQLANGLTVVGEVRHSAVSVGLGFFVKAGARDEREEISGVSHFLEHMMFKGTDRRSALDITYEFGAIGAQANAFTSNENTVYYAAVLPEYVASLFDILSDMMRPKLDPEEFETERNVILEEIALYEDRPTHQLFEAAMKGFFEHHSGGNFILGTNTSISSMTRTQMLEYFHERYSASNIVLCASGDFDWKELVELAERQCSHWHSFDVSRDYQEFSPAHGEQVLKKEGLERAYICLLAPGPSAQQEIRYSTQLLACALGDATGSRCYWELVDKGLADSASVDMDDMDNVGMIYGYASCPPENVEQVEQILRNIMADAADIGEAEFERAKTKVASRIVLQNESSMRRLMAVGLDWLYRREYQPPEREIEAIRRIDHKSALASLAEISFAPTYCVRLLPA